MLSVSDILVSARDILADQGKVRWSDEQLIRLLNDALDNLAINSNYSKARSYIEVEENITIYDLTDYAISIDRVEYIGTPLLAKSSEEMDRLDSRWLETTGLEPKYVIFDNLRQGSFRIYPRISSGAANIITQNSPYGGLIDITCVDDLLNLPSSDNLAFTDTKYLTVYYTKKPEVITNITDTVEIGATWKAAIAAFISGMALRADKDTQSRAFGMEQLAIYDRYLAKATSLESRASNTAYMRTFEYRGFQ